MTVYCGIDLGTSFCCVYYAKDKTISVLVMENGRHVFPSVVDFKDDGNVLVGYSALSAREIANGNVVMNWKLLFGKEYNEEYKNRVELSCRASVINNNGRYAFSVPSRNYPVSPEMVCSEILKWINKKMLAIAGGDSLEYCITLPAAYTIQQKKSMQKVIDLSGIEHKIKFVTEPAAAAISYSVDNMINNGHILVYDLGGGTFDASILKITNRQYKVINWKGDIDIGGEEFNMKILNWVNEKFNKEIGESILPETQNAKRDAQFIRAQMLLLDTCCEAKINLKTLENTSINLGDYYKRLYEKVKGKDKGSEDEEVDEEIEEVDEEVDEEVMTYDLDRQTFNGMIESQIHSTVDVMNLCVSTANMTIQNIDRIVMVGGSSQIPFVYETLCHEFGKDKISCSVNCSECVAQGAVMFISSQSLKDLTITECVTRSIYISIRPNHYRLIIEAGSEIPAEGHYDYFLMEENIGYATATIYESSADGKSYDLVGELIINDDSLAGRHVDLIYNFRIDNDFTLKTSFSEGDNILDAKELQIL